MAKQLPGETEEGARYRRKTSFHQIKLGLPGYWAVKYCGRRCDVDSGKVMSYHKIWRFADRKSRDLFCRRSDWEAVSGQHPAARAVKRLFTRDADDAERRYVESEGWPVTIHLREGKVEDPEDLRNMHPLEGYAWDVPARDPDGGLGERQAKARRAARRREEGAENHTYPNRGDNGGES